MSNRTALKRSGVVAALVMAAALTAIFAAPASAAKPPKGQVKVMTRNLYLGADLTPAITAPNSTALALAAQEIWNDVHSTQPQNRAKLQAKEIAKAKPDLVGLQEVALWRGDSTAPTQDGPVTPATDVEFDFLKALMNQLKKQGADYRVVRQQKEADIEAPLSGGDPGDGRLTMRDVVLARKGAGVSIENDYSQRFEKEHSLVVEDIGGITGFDVTVWRGFVAMDANVRGTEFRFVNSHLEAFDNDAKLAQAKELVQTVPDEPGPATVQSAGMPVVLVGDLNSDDEIVETLGDTPGHQADELPYAWLTSHGLEERSFDGLNTDGVDDLYSCCFNAELIDEVPATALDDIDHTVDHVMVSDDDPGDGNDPNSNDIDLVNSFRTGDKASEYSRFGHWASDHLGVISVLQFPTP